MDSKVKVINKLIEVGNEFTTENFCFPNDYDASEFGGDDTAKWLEKLTGHPFQIEPKLTEN